MELSNDERELFTKHIDKILIGSDPNAVTVTKVRDTLAEILDRDLTEQKAALKVLIKERFDEVLADEFETPVEPPPKKRKVKTEDDEDAKLAKKLQAEENATGRGARTTRNSGTKKAAKPKAAPRKKAKSKAAVDSADDSSAEPKRKRKASGNNAFNKPLGLSEPLAALVHAEQLSRPQTVKKIWEHIKAHNLQDPNDKRNINCDEAMFAVFKVDKVHMFTMNKLLGKHLYPLADSEIKAEVKDEDEDELTPAKVMSDDDETKVESEDAGVVKGEDEDGDGKSESYNESSKSENKAIKSERSDESEED